MYHYLKNLTATEQVGALFIIVFGLLLLASIAAVLMSLREFDETEASSQQRNDLHNFEGVLRTSWFMVFVFWIGWLSGDWVALTLFGFVSFFALRAIHRPCRPPDAVTIAAWCWLFLACCHPVLAGGAPSTLTCSRCSFRSMCFLAIPVTSALANDPQRFLERNAKLQWGIMVCIYGMSHVPACCCWTFRLRQQECLPGFLSGAGGADLHDRPAPGVAPTAPGACCTQHSATASTGPAGGLALAVGSVLGTLLAASHLLYQAKPSRCRL